MEFESKSPSAASVGAKYSPPISAGRNLHLSEGGENSYTRRTRHPSSTYDTRERNTILLLLHFGFAFQLTPFVRNRERKAERYLCTQALVLVACRILPVDGLHSPYLLSLAAPPSRAAGTPVPDAGAGHLFACPCHARPPAPDNSERRQRADALWPWVAP
eukprot:scaffold3941_cov412-Prasinococcus_capsulatus_cf.AAC.6